MNDDTVIEMEGSRAASRGLAVPQPQQSQLAASTGPSPAAMIEYVMQKGGTIEQLEKFWALHREMEADAARKAFADDMARFKAVPLSIVKDKTVKYKTDKGVTEYTHATIGNVCKVIVASLAEFGFSHRWTSTQEGGQLVVTCVITHRLGHSQSNTLQAAPDSSGGKNGIQSIGSTNTYLQRYTLLAATGVATEDQEDDDGRGAGVNPVDVELADKWIAKVKAAPTDSEVVAVWDAGIVAIEKAGDKNAYREFKEAVSSRRTAIAEAAAKAEAKRGGK
jgi:hypothetical protein